ncbi:dihydrodipicolinate synthase family protein [Embleya scabrispora]|uniref:Dihydrodipicolinate synthase family protein n=1 Tax=Embleya scabrispora TaxID=159449 RepID=A0A1T3NRL9_9ACTN|nr:dihydrodipicolinate synthase family protein [Embleya scabrispora]OPC79350.1 dihydrodipicolinate synthase family protein [Embleya scabrispora]
MDRTTVDWHGYIPAVTTPFTSQGDLDLAAWDEQLEWFAAEGLDGVVIAGTTGEWYTLTATERATLFTHAARRVRGRYTLLGGCNAYTAAAAIGHARAARAAGLDGILLTPPPYVVPNARETIAFYEEVSTAVDIPLCVYNWPRGTGVDLDTETLTAIADLPTVVAIKNSTGDFGGFVRGLVALHERVRYFGIPTDAVGAALMRGIGGDGLMGAGAVLGRDHPAFFTHLAAGDEAAALAVGARDRVLMRAWFTPDYGPRFASAPAILKHALTLRGVPAGHPRRPLLPLTAAEAEQVHATLAELGLVS